MSEVPVIINRLLIIKEQQERLEAEVAALWKAFFQIADREAGEGNAYRFLDPETGMAIARVIALSEIIDPEQLEAVLTHEQWLDVTRATRILDQARLEVEMDKGHIDKAIVEPCVSRKHTARKHGPRKATKDELEELTDQKGEAR